MKRVFRLKNGTWVYSDGELMLVERECNDIAILLKEPNAKERQEILEKIQGR